MKKVLKIIIIIILITLLIVGYMFYKIFSGPSVSVKEKRDVKKYVEDYLNKKYGEHEYKVTDVRYEYDMATLFDYSNPTGYWVDFKSDIVSDTWIIINGLNPNDYTVKNDYFIEDYYFPDQDGYDVYNIKENMKPKEELENMYFDALKEEFEPDIYEISCDIMTMDIPDDYGRIPTLEELETDINLYKVLDFNYKVSNSIKDTDEYSKRLKSYIKNKYNVNSDVYFYLENTSVSVFFEY